MLDALFAPNVPVGKPTRGVVHQILGNLEIAVNIKQTLKPCATDILGDRLPTGVDLNKTPVDPAIFVQGPSDIAL